MDDFVVSQDESWVIITNDFSIRQNYDGISHVLILSKWNILENIYLISIQRLY